MNFEYIKEKFFKLKEEVENFDKNIKIVLVTKYVSDISIISELFNIGVTDIAESYAQQMQYKYQELKNINFSIENYTWHFLGHLQKNKVKKVVAIADYIQSLDSIDLAEKINSVAEKNNKVCKCLVELKVSKEETKFGLEEENIFSVVETLFSKKFSNIKLVGLMTMAPYFKDPQLTRPYFKKAYNIFTQIKNKYKDFVILSMGMSNDYKIALEEGANMLRIGSLLFSSENN